MAWPAWPGTIMPEAARLIGAYRLICLPRFRFGFVFAGFCAGAGSGTGAAAGPGCGAAVAAGAGAITVCPSSSQLGNPLLTGMIVPWGSWGRLLGERGDLVRGQDLTHPRQSKEQPQQVVQRARLNLASPFKPFHRFVSDAQRQRQARAASSSPSDDGRESVLAARG